MIRGHLLTLALIAGVSQASAFDLKNMTDEERAEFGAAVRAYLLENPQVIFEAADVYERRQAEEQAMNDVDLIARNSNAIFDDGRSWVGGNLDGDITVVEFLDYRCGYCKRAFADVSELIASDGSIRIVFKEFPILGEESTLASRFAIAVRNINGNHAYKAAHDALMVMRGSVSHASLERIAGQLSLDYQTIKEGMGSPRVDEEIRDNYALGQKLGISGTPSFVFKTEMLRGYAPLDGMRQIVERVRG